MSTLTSPRRTKTSMTSMTSMELSQDRYDNLYSTDRAALYDTMARNLHHPEYRQDFVGHYNDLTRLNRKMHDLNYPCPRPRPKKMKKIDATAESRSHLTSTDAKFKSKYMSSYRLQQAKQPQKTLKRQILEKAAKGQFADPEKIVVAVVRSLLQAGCDPDMIEQAMQNVAIRFVADPETGELEISLHL